MEQFLPIIIALAVGIFLRIARKKAADLAQRGQEKMEAEAKFCNEMRQKPARMPGQTLVAEDDRSGAAMHEAADTPSAAAADRPSEAQHPLVRDFDLRKAVIYAEILKPKFQEEER